MKSKNRRIYIRHADKEYANGDANLYKHDPGITFNGTIKSKTVAEHLIKRWGIPSIIVVSPYRRTRETGSVMHQVVTNYQANNKTNSNITKDKIPIFVDTDLSEYLGNHRDVPIDVTESTQVHDPPHPESFSDMKHRVTHHYNRMLNITRTGKEYGVIWFITHGLIIKQVAKMSGITMAKEFPSLTCLAVSDDDSDAKGEIIIFRDTTLSDTKMKINTNRQKHRSKTKYIHSQDI